jgi:hypothetical protein
MEITTISLILAFIFVLLILGFTFDSYFLKLLPALFFLFLGLMVYVDPIEYQTGFNLTTVNASYKITTIDYTPMNNNITNVLAPFISLLGLGLGFFTLRDYLEEKKHKREGAE